MSCTQNNNSKCQYCDSCFNNCSSCPNKTCQLRTMYFNNLNRINKQVRMDSSSYLLRLRTLNISKQVGQGANPQMLEQAGGPGDLSSSIANTCKNIIGDCKQVTYRVPIVKRRTSYNGKIGVDKKHGSYARYLSRRVGGELRKEKMPGIRNRTAYIHQPRNRTGTQAGCFNKKSCSMLGFNPPSKFITQTRTAFKCNNKQAQAINNKTEIKNNSVYPRKGIHGQYLFGPYDKIGSDEGSCCSQKCCENRSPIKISGDDLGRLDKKVGQAVSSTRCSCCQKLKNKQPNTFSASVEYSSNLVV